MLFRAADLAGIARGEVTLAFRRWRRPTVRAGGTLQSRAGLLEIQSVDVVDPAAITDAEARRAGAPDADGVRAQLARRSDGQTYRIAFRLAGPDPRIALREDADLSPADREAIAARLDRFDHASARGPWTEATLRAIERSPGVRAPDLAAGFGLETLRFKADVRKLKALGLTESLPVGYRLSPRGRAFLDG